MKAIVWILLFAGMSYGAYNYGIPYLLSKAAPNQTDAPDAPAEQVAASTPPPAPAPVPAAAPAAAPTVIAPAAAIPTPAASLDAAPLQAMNPPASAAAPAIPAAPVHRTCATNVAAYDPNSPVQQLGWFKAGSDLEVSDCPKITGMKNVAFKDDTGQIIHAVCFEKDLNRTAEEAAAATTAEAPRPVVEVPKPLTFKRRNWAGEPNWQSVYDDPNHHMMTDKHGNQK